MTEEKLPEMTTLEIKKGDRLYLRLEMSEECAKIIAKMSPLFSNYFYSSPAHAVPISPLSSF